MPRFQQKQKQAEPQDQPLTDDIVVREPADLEATDDLIEEIDSILDSELVAAEYQQKGGQ